MHLLLCLFIQTFLALAFVSATASKLATKYACARGTWQGCWRISSATARAPRVVPPLAADREKTPEPLGRKVCTPWKLEQSVVAPQMNRLRGANRGENSRLSLSHYTPFHCFPNLQPIGPVITVACAENATKHSPKGLVSARILILRVTIPSCSSSPRRSVAEV